MSKINENKGNSTLTSARISDIISLIEKEAEFKELEKAIGIANDAIMQIISKDEKLAELFMTFEDTLNDYHCYIQRQFYSFGYRYGKSGL